MKTQSKFSCSLLVFIFFTGSYLAYSQSIEEIFKASGTPEMPKVNVSWNRYYTSEGIANIANQLAEAHPDLVRVHSIGKSYEGRDILMLEVSDFNFKRSEEKPGFYIDGNIHSNEIQGAEFGLYTAWYLVESAAENSFIQELLKDKVFYIVPTINPDARDNYMQAPNTAHSPRSGMIPFDDDRDGLYDEDGFDDINGDGQVTFMRRKNPNGRYKTDPDNPKWIIPAEPEEQGEFELLGYEGIDNDGDGLVNEDRVGGYYDPNRDWGWDWQPDYIQGGAYKYPFSVPENRAVADFFLSHPNIAGAQSYHNYGGMILRGPGTKYDEASFPPEDTRVYDAIGKRGDELLPGYKYIVLYKDLYPAFGGEIIWFHSGRGIFSFTNEIFTSYLMFYKEEQGYQEEMKKYFDFDKYLLFEDAFVEWKPFNHPTYGDIEIGGFKKNYSRAHPGFLLESDAHRNMAFTLLHAYHTPKLEIQEVKEEKLGNGLRQVTVTIANNRIIPTHSGQDLQYRIERPDYVIITGADVVSGMVVMDRDFNLTREQVYQPGKMEVNNIPGMGAVTLRWIIRGNADYNIQVNSAKGGVVSWK
jgi:hypothetical protein